MRTFPTFLIAILFSYCLGTAQNCRPSAAYAEIDANLVTAGLKVDGQFFWNGDRAKYQVPNSTVVDINAIFASGLWIAAEDEEGNPMVAAQHYPTAALTDFWPGPILLGQPIAQQQCEQWDRFFTVSKSEIEEHIQDFEDDGFVDVPLPKIYEWPGRNNPEFLAEVGWALPQDENLAPFKDRNGNGVYEPDLGDYPLIKGDEAFWWVFNDAGNDHRITRGEPLNTQIQVMAYAEASDIEEIDLTTFYDITIINKSTVTYYNLYTGLFVDPDLGCPADDFIGYDTTRHIAVIYNEDAIDGSMGFFCEGGINTYGELIPMVGVSIVESSFERNERSSFSVINGDINSFPATSSPQVASDYIAYLNGTWRDGTPFSTAGDGYDLSSSSNTKYAFHGDPSDPEGWSMCSAGLNGVDRRFVLNTGKETLESEQSITMTYAVITVLDVPHPCPSFAPMQEAYDVVVANIPGMVTSTEDLQGKETLLSVYPNPNNGMFSITTQSDQIHTIQILDLLGRKVEEIIVHQDNIDFNMTGQAAGVYFVLALDKNGNRLDSQRLVKGE